MTYAVGFLLESGLLFAADTRTNAGVDHVSTFRKITVFEKPGNRVMTLLSAGNLAITQAVIENLNEAIAAKRKESLLNVKTMFAAARLVGAAVRKVHDVDAAALRQQDTEFNVSFIFGGQIKGERHRLFQIYSAGNFIEATADSPYFQIGENKYGKPIIDRVITHKSSLMDAAKCTLLSFDSTMRSNVSVGLPINLATYRKNSYKRGFEVEVDSANDYYRSVGGYWSDALRYAFQEMPNPDWKI
ncbi:MAG: peptidase [Alphaproteobacteria bacterium]